MIGSTSIIECIPNANHYAKEGNATKSLCSARRIRSSTCARSLISVSLAAGAISAR